MKLLHSGITAIASLLVLAGASLAQGKVDALSNAAVPDRKATLEVWSFLPGNYEQGEAAFAQVVASYQAAYPQVTVNITEMPYGTYFDQVRNSVVAGAGPDVITMYGASQAYSYKNGLFPLQDAVDPTLLKRLSFVPENFSKDGNLYILPTGTYGYALVANDKIFAAAGIDSAKGLASWDSMLKTCAALNDKGIEPISSGWRDGFMLETYMYMISSQLMDAEKLEAWTTHSINMEDDLFVQTMNYIVDMRDAGCFGGEDALGRNMWDDTINRYSAGNAAMVVVGSVGTADWATHEQPDSSAHALPMVPTSPNDLMIDAGAEAGWAVTRWTENPEAALAFVSHMAGDEAQGTFATLANIPPNLPDTAINAETTLQKELIALFGIEGNHTGFASFPLPVLAVIERNAVPLMSRDMDVEAFLSAAQRAFRRIR